MATENNHDNKESVPEKSIVPNEIKATEAKKSEAVPVTATDKVNDAAKAAGNVFAKAKDLANDAIKTAKSDATKQSLNDAAKTAGAIGSKFLAKAKVVAGDVKKELKEVNDIRKDTFANAEAGTSKKALAKGFWAKLSGKQKGLLTGITAICIYFSYSVLFSDNSQITEDGYGAAVCAADYMSQTLIYAKYNPNGQEKHKALQLHNLFNEIAVQQLGAQKAKEIAAAIMDRNNKYLGVGTGRDDFDTFTKNVVPELHECDRWASKR